MKRVEGSALFRVMKMKRVERTEIKMKEGKSYKKKNETENNFHCSNEIKSDQKTQFKIKKKKKKN